MGEVKPGEIFDLAAWLPVLLVGLVVLFTPGSRWVSDASIDVQGAATFADSTIAFSRVIKRDFSGAWRMDYDLILPDGGTEPAASSRWKDEKFTRDTVLPERFTLDRFTPSTGIEDLPPGKYRLCFTWRINDGNWLFQRDVEACSGFEITGDVVPSDP